MARRVSVAPQDIKVTVYPTVTFSVRFLVHALKQTHSIALPLRHLMQHGAELGQVAAALCKGDLRDPHKG